MLSETQQHGLKWERWIANQLIQRGYKPRIPQNYFSDGCDLVLDDLCVEIKAARKTWRKLKLANNEFKYYPRWQWRIHPTMPRDKDWLLVLIAETRAKPYVYLIPGSQVQERPHIQLTSHPEKFNGWFAMYLERWEVIDYLQGKVYADNGPLFELWEPEHVPAI